MSVKPHMNSSRHIDAVGGMLHGAPRDLSAARSSCISDNKYLLVSRLKVLPFCKSRSPYHEE